MRQIDVWRRRTWWWHLLATLAVLLGLVGVAAPVLAANNATITLLAPGAPVNAMASVEWLDPATGAWLPVPGWTMALNQTTGSGVPFQTWGVFSSDYGRGPFRWVVSTGGASMGALNGQAMLAGMDQTEWGESSPFMLPSTDGVNLQITVLPVALLNSMANVVTNNNTGSANNSTNGNGRQACTGSACVAFIEATFTGLPSDSWITIQWQDGNGNWQPVMGWQGTADAVFANGMLTKRFGVYQQNYGQGPFRWAVFNSQTGGTLLDVSPSFNLPTTNGQVQAMSLAG